MCPLVRELVATDAPIQVPVAVTCRVLGLARQPYFRWLEQPVTDAELEEAHRANALFGAHRDDAEFGYRFLLDEARDAGSRWPTALRGGSARTTAGGRRSGRRRLAGRARSPARRSTTTGAPWSTTGAASGTSSTPTPRTSCGSPASPSIGPGSAAHGAVPAAAGAGALRGLLPQRTSGVHHRTSTRRRTGGPTSRRSPPAGVHSVHAFPMRLRDRVIGTLNVFGEDKLPLDEDDAKVIRRWPMSRPSQ